MFIVVFTQQSGLDWAGWIFCAPKYPKYIFNSEKMSVSHKHIVVRVKYKWMILNVKENAFR